MMNNFMNGMFGKIGSGMCKLSMNGNIAVKTSNGYDGKQYTDLEAFRDGLRYISQHFGVWREKMD